MNNLESPIVGKLDDNLYMCANGDVVIAVDEVMGDNNYSAEGYANAKGRGKKFFKKVGKGVVKGVKFVGKKVYAKTLGSVARLPFLGLIRLNFWGWATRMEKDKSSNSDNWKKTLQRWDKFGGEKRPLEKAVNAGFRKKPLIIKIGKKKGADGSDYLYAYIDEDDYFNAVGTAASAALASIPVITALIPLLGKPKGVSDEDVKELENEAAKMEAEAAKENNFFNKYKWHMIIGGSLIALGTTAYFLLRKKQQ